ncbi:hypothetical protein PFISCL1PPCAC_14018, partial [Pristionchus fissidentatus]
NYEMKHILHCFALYSFIAIFIYFSIQTSSSEVEISLFERYGTFGAILLYVWRFLPVLILPQCLFHLVGLTFFNPFKKKISLKAVPLLSPFVCFRVVTRGLYPRLVKENIILNMETCKNAGMANFMFEIVTDNRLNLPAMQLVREIVVPPSYETKSGALFKARALQYCLEEEVNRLQDSDWVVHLDEETLLTTNSVCGILNFVEDGKHQFGQGVITYANGEIVNWFATLSDTYRVSDDLGKLRTQLSIFHKPLFGWKGSFVVSKYGAERTISWDHGPDGSIAEDTFFALIAQQAGYSFNYVEGEMLEKSPFTIIDFLQQRKRWLEGLLLCVHAREIRLPHRIPLASAVYTFLFAPLMFLQVLLLPYLHFPRVLPLEMIIAFLAAINIYMHVFGVCVSFNKKYRKNFLLLFVYCIGSCITILFTVFIESAAVFLYLFGPKKTFYIVQKETTPLIDV